MKTNGSSTYLGDEPKVRVAESLGKARVEYKLALTQRKVTTIDPTYTKRIISNSSK